MIQSMKKCLYVCLHGMDNEYRVFLKNLSFPLFQDVGSIKMNEQVCEKDSKVKLNHYCSETFPKKKAMVTAVEKG